MFVNSPVEVEKRIVLVTEADMNDREIQGRDISLMREILELAELRGRLSSHPETARACPNTVSSAGFRAQRARRRKCCSASGIFFFAVGRRQPELSSRGWAIARA